MAIPQQQQQQVGHDFELSSHQPGSVEQNPSLLLDALYCEEDRWEDEVEEEEGEVVLHVGSFEYGHGRNVGTRKDCSSLSPPLLLEQDLFWEDEELTSLFFKEQEQVLADGKFSNVEADSSLSMARQEAVGWMLKVIAYYGFSTLTAILSINYLDRFLSSPCFQKDKPWMIQLVAVTCLSLAAKVEETEVPLLLDLQVEETKNIIFEAKAIQRMELLVLSTLKWRMHPVTPLSFLDHIVRRLGLKTHTHWEFRKRCERLLLSVVPDSRSVRHLPSVLATATMMHVIDQVELFNPIDYQDQLLGVLKISKEKVEDCYGLILELLSKEALHETNACHTKSQKRKYHRETTIPSSPSGVIDASVFSCDSSNDSCSWGLGSSVSSSPAAATAAAEPLFKKSRTQDQWVFVDIAGSSPR